MIEVRDPDRVERQIVEGIKSYFRSAGFHKAVVGLSGGLDSSVTLSLTVKALSPNNTFAVMLPSRDTPRTDLKDARNLLSVLKVPPRNVVLIRMGRILRSIRSSLGEMKRMEMANTIARARMIVLHALAYRKGALVVGTGDRSEIAIGYFTKYGDGGVDVLPLGCLLKTQVRHMARHLGLPKSICEKPSSPRLWAYHLAERELGVGYEVIDEFIHLHLDQGKSAEEASAATGVSLSTLKKLENRMLSTAHKRLPPARIECDPW